MLNRYYITIPAPEFLEVLEKASGAERLKYIVVDGLKIEVNSNSNIQLEVDRHRINEND